MDNTYRVLPWKRARHKGFSTVKAPKSRSVSSLDDISNDRTSNRSTTSLRSSLSMDDINTQVPVNDVEMKQSTSSSDIQHQRIDLQSPDSSGDKSFISDQNEDVEGSPFPNNSAFENSVNVSVNLTSRDTEQKHDKIPAVKRSSIDDKSRSPKLLSLEKKRINTKQRTSAFLEDQFMNRQKEYSLENYANDNKPRNGNNIIILNNVGVENANEYDRLHPHEHNQLALLLQELDSLIKSLPPARQIGTPFSSSNFVAAQLDHRGGRIRLSEPDVCMCVPPGALPQGKPQTLYMYIVNPRIPALSEFRDEDHWLTPIVHCGPPGIQFQSYVALSLPSSVADESGWNFTVSRGVQPEYTEWESLESRDDSVVLVKSGRITVLVDHFTPYGAKGKPSSGDTAFKWMEAGVFIHPPCGENSEEEVQFHVRIWNVADRQRVLQEERKLLRTCLAEPIRAIRVHDSGCPVQVQVDEVRPLWVLWNHTGKVIPFQNLWREQRGADCPDCPSITFVAQASEAHLSDWHRGSFRATVRLFQHDHDSEGISFIVRANPEKMATFVFKDGQLRDERGTTYLKQQPGLDPMDVSTPFALFPLSEDHFHEVCLQLDGTPTDVGEKSWRAFARTADLNRKELDAIKRCAQQHQHKSPSDLVLTYFVGDPCRRFDTLRTLQEIWYVLYHIGNDGGREEVEEEMYHRMTIMKGRPKERVPSDISSAGTDHPSDLSSLVMTSDEQMSDVDEKITKDKPLGSTTIVDKETLTESAKANDSQELSGPVSSTHDVKDTNNKETQPKIPMEEAVTSNKELILNTEPIVDHSISLTNPSHIQEPYTDISDDLEMQLTEFSKHWAVSEDSLGSDSDLSPSSEAELLKILLANDGSSQLTENGVLSLDDPQRQEVPLNFQPIVTSENEVHLADPNNMDDDSSLEGDIVIYRDTGAVVERKHINQETFVGDEPDKESEEQKTPQPTDDAVTLHSLTMSPEMHDRSLDSTSTSHQDVSESASDIELEEFSPLLAQQETQENTKQNGVIQIMPTDESAVKRVSECVDKERDSGQGSLPGEVEESTSKVPVVPCEEQNTHPIGHDSPGIPNGKLPHSDKSPKSSTPVNGKIPPKSPVIGKSIRIAYRTEDDPTENQQHPNSNHNNGNHQSMKPSSTWPLSNGTPSYVSNKNGSNSVPDLGKKVRSHPRSPKSPKREDRDCLRQLARLALTGKSEEEEEDEMRTASTSPHPVFDFSLLQPARKEEEFV